MSSPGVQLQVQDDQQVKTFAEMRFFILSFSFFFFFSFASA
jgi:hypothetical protein